MTISLIAPAAGWETSFRGIRRALRAANKSRGGVRKLLMVLCWELACAQDVDHEVWLTTLIKIGAVEVWHANGERN